MPAGRSVVDGGVVPYQPWAAAKKRDNFAKRATADPLAECYMAGVPRIMYMEFPFQIFQTRDAVAMLFEWQQIYRLIYTNGSQSPEGIPFWMGDSRGRWEGDTLVVETVGFNEKAWIDRAGTPHTEKLRYIERFTRTDYHNLRYEVTIDDPDAYSATWSTIAFNMERNPDRELFEYQCQQSNFAHELMVGTMDKVDRSTPIVP